MATRSVGGRSIGVKTVHVRKQQAAAALLKEQLAKRNMDDYIYLSTPTSQSMKNTAIMKNIIAEKIKRLVPQKKKG